MSHLFVSILLQDFAFISSKLRFRLFDGRPLDLTCLGISTVSVFELSVLFATLVSCIGFSNL